MVKEGSLWGDMNGKNFRVISVAQVDGHTWVYYREDFGYKTPEEGCKQYSCYQESFVQRFRQLPE